MTINNKSERNYRGKSLGWPVTSYGGALSILIAEETCMHNLLDVFDQESWEWMVRPKDLVEEVAQKIYSCS